MLDIEQQSGVTVIRMRHGKVNAQDLELLLALTEVMRELDPETAVVITGSGTVFSAGVDLNRIVSGGQAYIEEFIPALSDVFLAVFGHPGPVVAAVDGAAIAGGCVLAASCDVRLMSQGRIGLAELSVGVPFPPVALEIMRHAVGPAAGHLVLTATLLDKEQARDIGLVHELPEPDSLLEAAVDRAARMARVPADVFAFSKRQWQRPARERIAARDADDAAVLAMWAADSTRDAIAAYLDSLKRRSR